MIISTVSALPFSASADNDYYLVVGDNAEIFGTVWDASNSSNIMTPDGNGKYTKSYTVSKAYKKVMLKVVSNSGWYGDEQGKNYAFKIKGTGTFTVSFDTSINKIEVTGSIVAPITLDYSYVNVVGNGSGNWLNGVAWIPGDSANKMTEISQDVWQIEYNDVPAGSDYTFKFVVDGSYETNFGGTLSANGVYEDAVYNGNSITFTTTETSNVVIILDLSDYDHSSKQGAKFTVIYEMVELSYVLKESYGDGWNTSALIIKDVTNNRDMATLSISNDGITEQPGSLTLAKGHTYQFIWNAGNYPYECGLTLKNGDDTLLNYTSMEGVANGTVLLEYTAGVQIEKYNLWVGSTQITSANAADVFGDGKVKYNDETKTLTLNNFNFEGAGYNYSDSDYYGAVIYYYNEKNEITLELIGTNTIKETYGSISSNALRFTGSLKITGSGTLNAISCDASGNTSGIVVKGNLTIPEDFTGVINATSGNGAGSAFAYGISCGGVFDISGGTINAASGTGKRTYGIECENMIVNGGTVNATGGDTTGMSSALTYGIMTKMSFIINGGAVTAKSGKTANKDYCRSYGLSAIYVYINGGTVTSSSDYATSGSKAVYYEKDYGSINIADNIIATASEYNDGSNAVAYNKTENDKYKWFKSKPTPPHTHSLTKVPAVEPTTAKAGHSEYYVCDCGKWFEDAAGKKEITDRQSVVIPKIVLPPEDAKLPTEAKTEEVIIKTNTDVKDIKGSQFRKLKLKATGKKKAIELSWKKIKGANGYIIYGSPCGKDIKMKKLKTIKSAKTVKHTFKKLKKGKYYKYIVVAYKITADGKKRVITKSKSAHCTTQGGKKGNPSEVTVKKNKLTVKKGKTVQISGKVRSKPKMSAHIPVARFESSNTKIATVDKNGKVKGRKKGKVTIYVFAQNGIYKTVKITVK